MDLSAFYADYRADGHGRPAHDPAMMVALLVYAYARGQRSSRVIERRALRTSRSGSSAPTGARSHDDRAVSPAPRARVGGAVRAGAGALRAGRPGRMSRCWRSMARRCTPTRRSARRATTSRSPREALEEAAEVDAAEDEQFGDRRGDELPAELATAPGPQEVAEADAAPAGRQRAAGGPADPAAASRARSRGQAASGRRARRPSARQRRLRGLPARGVDEERPPVRRAAQALHAARAAGRARSTSPTRTRATSRRRADGCRATTPRRSATSSRSSSPPRSRSARRTSASSAR